MQAVIMRQTGGPEVLVLEEVQRPEPAEGEVLIRVRAASVNPIEWKYRRGLMPKQLPAVLGSDVSGTVELSRADGFAEGDDVFGFGASGAYAEFATAPGAMIVKKPDGVSHEQAAGIPVAGLTAWQALFDVGGLARGQTALIAGAAGGVGHFAVQLAGHAGAHVIGTGSAHSREFVVALGADEFIDYGQQDVGQAVNDADVVFDTVGGDTTRPLLSALTEGGILVTIAGAPPEDAARELGVRAELLIMSPRPELLTRIAELVAAGELRVEIAHTLALSDVSRAHELSEAGHTRGKIILTVGG